MAVLDTAIAAFQKKMPASSAGTMSIGRLRLAVAEDVADVANGAIARIRLALALEDGLLQFGFQIAFELGRAVGLGFRDAIFGINILLDHGRGCGWHW